MASTLEDVFYIGYITKTKGLKGEIQLFFEFEEYDLLDLNVVFIEQQGSLVPFFTTQVKIQNNSTAYIYFEDIDHIDKAQKLIKSKVYLTNDKMPVRDEDTFYYSDLKNYLVIDLKCGNLGKVIDIQELPQQVIATVQYQDSEIMFPLNDDFILEIDEENQNLTVQLPEGLIDLYINPS